MQIKSRGKFLGALLAIVFAAFCSAQVFAQAVPVPPAMQCFQATTGINGMVGTLGAITAGSGGTSGTYTNVALTGGSGTTATANITVSGGGVTAVTILSPGINYAVGDVLSAAGASIGGVSGFTVPVASIAINSSLSGGYVGMYIPNTLTPATTWQNAAETIQNQNPILLDSNGCALIYGVGLYRQIVYDNLGNVVWDRVTSVNNGPLYGGLAGGTANAQTVTQAGFGFNDGQQITYKAPLANTGAATLAVNATSPVAIYKDTPAPSALAGGEIAAGAMVTVTYDATANVFHLTSVDNVVLASNNTTFTGNNTFNGTSTFAGASTFNAGATFNAQTAYKEQTLTITSGNVAWDASQAPDAYVTTGSAVTFSAQTNTTAGDRGHLRVNNSSSSPIAVTWDSSFAALGNLTALPSYIPPGTSYFDWWRPSSTTFISYAAAGGAMPVLVNRFHIANGSATVQDITSFTGQFRNYQILFENVRPQSNNVNVYIQFYQNSTFSNLVNVKGVFANHGSSGAFGFDASSYGYLCYSSNVQGAAGGGLFGTILVQNPSGSGVQKNVTFSMSSYLDYASYPGYYAGTINSYATTAPLNGFLIGASSGLLADGTVSVYGWN